MVPLPTLELVLWLDVLPSPCPPSTPSVFCPPLRFFPPDVDRVDDSVSDESVTTLSLTGIVLV